MQRLRPPECRPNRALPQTARGTRQRRIEEIKREIEAGTYEVDSRELGKKIIEAHLVQKVDDPDQA